MLPPKNHSKGPVGSEKRVQLVSHKQTKSRDSKKRPESLVSIGMEEDILEIGFGWIGAVMSIWDLSSKFHGHFRRLGVRGFF